MRAEFEQTHQCRNNSYVKRAADIDLLKVFIQEDISYGHESELHRVPSAIIP
jgi:hypothetical protein